LKKVDRNLIAPSEKPATEAGHAIVRAALSTVPVVGGALVEAFCALLEPPMQRRRTAWMIQVSEAINDLLARGEVSADDLQHNDVFLTTVASATQIALRNHQQEKIEFLKAAVINSAVGPTVDESLQQFLLGLIDSLTVYHSKVLILFDDPVLRCGERNIAVAHLATGPNYTRYTILALAFPELAEDSFFCNQIWNDLTQRGLLRPDRTLNNIGQGESILFGCSSPLGRKYIEYISR
jgi:hypothetical protein